MFAQTNPWCFQLQVQRHTRHISRPATSHAECAATDARGLSGLTTYNISSHAQRQGGMQHADNTLASAIALPATQVPLASLQAHCTLHHSPANRDAQTCQSNSSRPTRMHNLPSRRTSHTKHTRICTDSSRAFASAWWQATNQPGPIGCLQLSGLVVPTTQHTSTAVDNGTACPEDKVLLQQLRDEPASCPSQLPWADGMYNQQ